MGHQQSKAKIQLNQANQEIILIDDQPSQDTKAINQNNIETKKLDIKTPTYEDILSSSQKATSEKIIFDQFKCENLQDQQQIKRKRGQSHDESREQLNFKAQSQGPLDQPDVSQLLCSAQLKELKMIANSKRELQSSQNQHSKSNRSTSEFPGQLFPPKKLGRQTSEQVREETKVESPVQPMFQKKVTLKSVNLRHQLSLQSAKKSSDRGLRFQESLSSSQANISPNKDSSYQRKMTQFCCSMTGEEVENRPRSTSFKKDRSPRTPLFSAEPNQFSQSQYQFQQVPCLENFQLNLHSNSSQQAISKYEYSNATFYPGRHQFTAQTFKSSRDEETKQQIQHYDVVTEQELQRIQAEVKNQRGEMREMRRNSTQRATSMGGVISEQEIVQKYQGQLSMLNKQLTGISNMNLSNLNRTKTKKGFFSPIVDVNPTNLASSSLCTSIDSDSFEENESNPHKNSAQTEISQNQILAN